MDEYIAQQSPQVQEKLQLMRQTIKNAVPGAVEVISYQMPAFKFHGMLVFFAVFKNHYSLFVSPPVREAFKDKLTGFTLTKSAIHFPLDLPVPEQLITEIVIYAANNNLQKAELKERAKRSKTK